MKKPILFIAGLLSIGAAKAQIYFSDDFEGGSLTGNNAWTTQVVDDPNTTNEDWELGTVGGNYARVSNYTGQSNVLNTWLISPAIDLSAGTAINMNFNMTKRFAGDDMIVHISNNYDGSSAPSSATWSDITTLFTLDTDIDSWAFVPSGDGDISTYVSGTSTYIAFEYIGGASNGSTWEVDDIQIQEGATTIPTLTIYDIQYTLADPADSPEDGNVVTTSGVVTAISGGDSGDGYFIQDEDGSWNGIVIVDGTNTPAVGDSVEVTGTVEENFDFTRISGISAFTNHGTATWQPTAAAVSSNDAATLEEYEGVLVTISETECTNDNAGFGLWETNDGSGALNVDDDCFDNSADLGNWYDLTGVISYSFSEYKINPRTGADQVAIEFATIVDNTVDFEIYPNPANDLVQINAGVEAQINIYAMTGALVISTNNETQIDVSDLEAGVYTVTVTENGVTGAKRIIIQ